MWRAVPVASLVLLSLAGCAVAPSATKPAPEASSAVGPQSATLVLGRPAAVGPYSVAVTRSTVTTGKASFNVQIKNRSTETTAPRPPLLTFRLVDDRGTTLTYTGTVYSRPRTTDGSPPGGSAPGTRTVNASGDYVQGLPPGTYVNIVPLFAVPPGVRPARLTYAPLNDAPEVVLTYDVQ